MTRASSSPRKIREASRHVVIDVVLASEDGSRPCRSVRHRNRQLAPTSQKGQDLSMKRASHPLSSTSVGREVGKAGSASVVLY